MTDGAALTFYLLLLILPIAALAGRRMPIRQWLPMALAWAAIFGIGWLIASYFT